ncbi:MAG: FAD-dependent oxidoreductase [Bacteroidia bacterium]|nr:FAD-dependent oxidoreductase [Bacteroidia bacterium]
MESSQRKLLIAGGGSSGLGTALAAARRGWKVVIFEAQDIGGGTSTTSTKLIHGGIRYLESAIKTLRLSDWHLVREALRERKWMIESHPHLCAKLPIILPVANKADKIYYGIGLTLYDYLSYPYRLAPKEWIDMKAFYEYFPIAYRKFIGGWLYWDGQFEDRLYAVHLALYLRQRFGVDIRTYHRVMDIEVVKDEVRVCVETAGGERYVESGDFLINATGPWGDFLRKRLRPHTAPRLRISRGSHLVLKGLPPLKAGFLIPRTVDNRVLFILPWKEGTWLLGTTDEEAEAPEWNAPVPAKEESYLRAYLARYFEQSGEVVARFAGFRPLVFSREQTTSRIARNHVIEVWEAERTIHLMGGKWTTFRSMGEDTVRTLYTRLLRRPVVEGEPVTQIVPDLSDLEALKHIFPQPIVEGEPFTEGEVRFWRRLGWAHTPADIVEGRWQLHLINENRSLRLKSALQARWSELT